MFTTVSIGAVNNGKPPLSSKGYISDLELILVTACGINNTSSKSNKFIYFFIKVINKSKITKL
jgi:hypothetical protein